jgi:hypothetical protein
VGERVGRFGLEQLEDLRATEAADDDGAHDRTVTKAVARNKKAPGSA